MRNTNYKLPLAISRFFSDSGGSLEQCSELESIDQFLALLVTTRPGEHAFDLQFGMKIWELDFENIVSIPAWTAQFTDYIMQAVGKNEKRLKDVNVTLEIRDVLRENTLMDALTIRKQVDIVITGTVVSTGKRHGFKHVVYLGPLSRG